MWHLIFLNKRFEQQTNKTGKKITCSFISFVFVVESVKEDQFIEKKIHRVKKIRNKLRINKKKTKKFQKKFLQKKNKNTNTNNNNMIDVKSCACIISNSTYKQLQKPQQHKRKEIEKQ